MKFLKRLLNIVVAGAVACFVFFGAGNASARAEATEVTSPTEETPSSEVITPKKTLKEWWLERSDVAAKKELEAQIAAGVFEKGELSLQAGQSCAGVVNGGKFTRGKNSGQTFPPLLQDIGIDPKIQYRAVQLLNTCSNSSPRVGKPLTFIKKPKQGLAVAISDSDPTVESDIANVARSLLDGRIDILSEEEQKKLETAHGAVDIVYELMTVVERQQRDIKDLGAALMEKSTSATAAPQEQSQRNIIQKAQLFLQGRDGFIGSVTRYWLPSGLLSLLLGILLCYALVKSVWRSRELKRDLNAKREEYGDLRATLGVTLQGWQEKFLAQTQQFEGQIKALKDLEMQVRGLIGEMKHVPTQTSELLLAALKNGGKLQSPFRPSIADQASEAVVAQAMAVESSPPVTPPTPGEEEVIQVVRYDGTAWNLPVHVLESDKYNFRCLTCGERMEGASFATISSHWLNGSKGSEPCYSSASIPALPTKVGMEKTQEGITYRVLPGGECKTLCQKCGKIVTSSSESICMETMKKYHKNCDASNRDVEAGTVIQPRFNPQPSLDSSI